MSAFLVTREHIDLLVATALAGPRGVPVAPDSPIATCFPVRWYAKHWHEVTSYQDFASSRRRLVRARYRGDDSFNRDPSQVGQLLWDANLTSVRTRYPDMLDNPTPEC